MNSFGIRWDDCSAKLAQRMRFSFLGPACDGLETVTVTQSKMYNGIYIQDVSTITSLSFPNCTEFVMTGIFSGTPDNSYAIFLENLTQFTDLDCPLCVRAGPDIRINFMPALTNINFPNLEWIDNYALPPLGAGNGLTLRSVTALNTLSFPKLRGLSTATTGNPTQATFEISSSPLLTTIVMPLWRPLNGSTNNFTGNGLTQGTVDTILNSAVVEASFISGTLDLSGGTNSTPSAAGLINKGLLNGRGVTCTTN